jgi:hypothetical protein
MKQEIHLYDQWIAKRLLKREYRFAPGGLEGCNAEPRVFRPLSAGCRPQKNNPFPWSGGIRLQDDYGLTGG